MIDLFFTRLSRKKYIITLQQSAGIIFSQTPAFVEFPYQYCRSGRPPSRIHSTRPPAQPPSQRHPDSILLEFNYCCDKYGRLTLSDMPSFFIASSASAMSLEDA